jgi:hypothetical protein
MSSKKTVVLPEIKLGVKDRDYRSTPLLKKHAGKSIYKIEYDVSKDQKCVNYVDTENKHVVFKNMAGEYVLFHIEDEPITEKMLAALQRVLSKKLRTQRNQDLLKDAVILQSCIPDVDLTTAQHTLSELNVLFEKKCPNLTLKLKHFFDYSEPMSRYSEEGHVCIGCKFYDTLILAICKKPDEKCISTIELIFTSEGELLINSKTDTAGEGKKYNKILRTILFIVGDKIDGAKYIKSVAFNPISAWLLLKYSKASIEPEHPFEEFMKDKKLTQEVLKEYYDAKNKPIHLIVPLNKTTSDNSLAEFNKTLDEIKCE